MKVHIEDSITNLAYKLTNSILQYYDGTVEEKLEKTDKFVSELLFKYQIGINNPLDNSNRKMYEVCQHAKKFIIPLMKLNLEDKLNSDPIEIHDWN